MIEKLLVRIMNETVKFIYCYFVILLIVSVCWFGLEYVFEGCIRSSEIDGFVAAVFSWFITDKLCD